MAKKLVIGRKSRVVRDKTFEEHLDEHMNNLKNTPHHVKRHLRKHIRSFHKVIREGDSPEKIAGSFALGAFIAFLPILWFHIFILIPIMLLTRVNRVALVLGTFVLHPLALYVLTPLSFKVGALLLDYETATFSFRNIHLAFPSLLLGGIIFGAIFAVISYFITYFAVIKYRERQAVRERKK